MPLSSLSFLRVGIWGSSLYVVWFLYLLVRLLILLRTSAYIHRASREEVEVFLYLPRTRVPCVRSLLRRLGLTVEEMYESDAGRTVATGNEGLGS